MFGIFAWFKTDYKLLLVFEQQQQRLVMLNGKGWLMTLFGTAVYNDGSQDIIEVMRKQAWNQTTPDSSPDLAT